MALAVLCAGVLMVVLDGTIVMVALPAIQSDLGFSQSGLAWVVNSYGIAFAGLLLLAGRLGDLIGRRRMFVAGMVVFTAASLLCGVATGPQLLIAARFLQGAGGAMSSAVAIGMIVTLFPDPKERAKAIGAFSFVGAAGASIGLVLGGVLTEALTWHWIFFVNVPIGIAATVLAFRFLVADRGLGLSAGADMWGALAITSGLMLLVYTIVEAAGNGWASVRTLGLGAVALLLIAGFVWRQAKARTPLLPLRVFRSRQVSGANAIQLLMVGALFGFQLLIVLYLQHVLGYGAARSGLSMLPSAVVIGIITLGFSARINARFGERNVVIAGLVVLLAGLLFLTRVPADGNYFIDVLPALLALSGFGLAIPALTTLGMSGATAEDAGAVGGLFNTTQQVGGALGIAVLNTLSSGRAENLLAEGKSNAEALTGGYSLAFGIGAGLIAAAITLTVPVLRTPKRNTVVVAEGEADREREQAEPFVHLV
ncbi:DHA2 family efflux MFS transporter permease subunit [Streptomyces sp. SID3343]|uniref:DHA2 family efflux MFS transporter permease subunit n=1 Tax=Streptomyces sp. SID3343 TaxID=2690260 RepID=UPI0023510BFD|nr:DHA2 family efflux MFS transporter permease subunit [Streptomyces sp. SID3343]